MIDTDSSVMRMFFLEREPAPDTAWMAGHPRDTG